MMAYSRPAPEKSTVIVRTKQCRELLQVIIDAQSQIVQGQLATWVAFADDELKKTDADINVADAVFLVHRLFTKIAIFFTHARKEKMPPLMIDGEPMRDFLMSVEVVKDPAAQIVAQMVAPQVLALPLSPPTPARVDPTIAKPGNLDPASSDKMIKGKSGEPASALAKERTSQALDHATSTSLGAAQPKATGPRKVSFAAESQVKTFDSQLPIQGRRTVASKHLNLSLLLATDKSDELSSEYGINPKYFSADHQFAIPASRPLFGANGEALPLHNPTRPVAFSMLNAQKTPDAAAYVSPWQAIQDMHDRLASRNLSMSKDEQKYACFVDLPDEIIAIILGRIDLKTIFHMRRVNKRYYTIVQQNMIRIATPSVHTWQESRDLVKRIRDLDDPSVKTEPTNPWVPYAGQEGVTVAWCIDKQIYSTGAKLSLDPAMFVSFWLALSTFPSLLNIEIESSRLITASLLLLTQMVYWQALLRLGIKNCPFLTPNLLKHELLAHSRDSTQTIFPFELSVSAGPFEDHAAAKGSLGWQSTRIAYVESELPRIFRDSSDHITMPNSIYATPTHQNVAPLWGQSPAHNLVTKIFGNSDIDLSQLHDFGWEGTGIWEEKKAAAMKLRALYVTARSSKKMVSSETLFDFALAFIRMRPKIVVKLLMLMDVGLFCQEKILTGGDCYQHSLNMFSALIHSDDIEMQAYRSGFQEPQLMACLYIVLHPNDKGTWPSMPAIFNTSALHAEDALQDPFHRLLQDPRVKVPGLGNMNDKSSKAAQQQVCANCGRMFRGVSFAIAQQKLRIEGTGECRLCGDEKLENESFESQTLGPYLSAVGQKFTAGLEKMRNDGKMIEIPQDLPKLLEGMSSRMLVVGGATSWEEDSDDGEAGEVTMTELPLSFHSALPRRHAVPLLTMFDEFLLAMPQEVQARIRTILAGLNGERLKVDFHGGLSRALFSTPGGPAALAQWRNQDVAKKASSQAKNDAEKATQMAQLQMIDLGSANASRIKEADLPQNIPVVNKEALLGGRELHQEGSGAHAMFMKNQSATNNWNAASFSDVDVEDSHQEVFDGHAHRQRVIDQYGGSRVPEPNEFQAGYAQRSRGSGRGRGRGRSQSLGPSRAHDHSRGHSEGRARSQFARRHDPALENNFQASNRDMSRGAGGRSEGRGFGDL